MQDPWSSRIQATLFTLLLLAAGETGTFRSEAVAPERTRADSTRPSGAKRGNAGSQVQTLRQRARRLDIFLHSIDALSADWSLPPSHDMPHAENRDSIEWMQSTQGGELH